MTKKSINDYFNYKETHFFNLLKSTQKWKELYNQAESFLALIVSIIVAVLLPFLLKSDIKAFNDLIGNLLNIVITTLAGMLGLVISGMAIFTGTITNKLVNNIENQNKASDLIGVLFSFYYLGAIMGITIVFSVIVYIVSFFNTKTYLWAVFAVALLLAYLYFYSIFYSISLIGTCLKLFLVSYKFSGLSENKKNSCISMDVENGSEKKEPPATD